MKKKPVVYAFIDSQNLNLGVRSQGWRIDYKKFRLYLKNKYNVQQAFMFIGMVDGNRELYDGLQAAGFSLVFKPTIHYFEKGKKTVKGNVDAELVLHAAAIEYSNYDKAIIVTGDGDFHCLVRYLEEKGKLLHLMAPTRRYSKLLKGFSGKIVQIQEIRHNFIYKKSRDRRSVETLGLPGHGDTIDSIPNRLKRVKATKVSKKTSSSGRISSLGQPNHGDKSSTSRSRKKSSTKKPKDKS